MSKGVVFHWATHTAPACAHTGSQVTPAQAKLRLVRPSWVPTVMYMENSHNGTSADLQVNHLLLDCSISSFPSQDTHHQAQPTAPVHAEVSMTRPPSWPSPQGNQWEKRDNRVPCERHVWTGWPQQRLAETE